MFKEETRDTLRYHFQMVWPDIASIQEERLLDLLETFADCIKASIRSELKEATGENARYDWV